MHQYESIIKMHDIAITLLERNNYNESIETFKDVVNLMKHTFGERNNVKKESDNRMIHTCDDNSIESMSETSLSKASMRITKTSCSTGCQSVSGSISKSQSNNSFVRIFDTSSPDAMSVALSNPSSYPKDFILCIDYDNTKSNIDEKNSEQSNIILDSGIVLYNYAVACNIASRNHSRPEERMGLRQKSTKIFELAYNIISSEIEHCSNFLDNKNHDDDDNQDEYYKQTYHEDELREMLKLVWLGMLITKNICTILCNDADNIHHIISDHDKNIYQIEYEYFRSLFLDINHELILFCSAATGVIVAAAA